MGTAGAVLDSLEPIPGNEFNYRPVPPLVPVSAIFVVLSATAYAWDLLVTVPILGSVLAYVAWRQVARSDGLYCGGGVAKACLLVMPLMAASAITLHAYTYATEVPEGFARVSFATDISDKGFVMESERMGLHPEVARLTEKPIFLKGYMYPTKEQHELHSFVLCKDSGDCCFGGQPKPTDMIYIEMQAGKTADFYSGLVSVAGVFKATPTLDPTGLNPVYKLECDFFSNAKTSY